MVSANLASDSFLEYQNIFNSRNYKKEFKRSIAKQPNNPKNKYNEGVKLTEQQCKLSFPVNQLRSKLNHFLSHPMKSR